MLHFVHKWIQENQTDADPLPRLSAHLDEEWGKAQEGLNGAQAVLLFKQLVEEGRISLVYPLDTNIAGIPWSSAYPQKLSKWALVEIGELDDPDRELAAIFQSALDKIQKDPSVPQSQKQSWIESLNLGLSLMNTGMGLAENISKTPKTSRSP